MKHGLTPPDQFERGTAAIIAEEVAEQALKQLDAEGADYLTLLAHLIEVEQLTQGADMHDQIRAKLFKALGSALRAAGQLPEAHANLTRALELNDRIGVKKDLERLERELKQNAAQPKADS